MSCTFRVTSTTVIVENRVHVKTSTHLIRDRQKGKFPIASGFGLLDPKTNPARPTTTNTFHVDTTPPSSPVSPSTTVVHSHTPVPNALHRSRDVTRDRFGSVTSSLLQVGKGVQNVPGENRNPTQLVCPSCPFMYPT